MTFRLPCIDNQVKFGQHSPSASGASSSTVTHQLKFKISSLAAAAQTRERAREAVCLRARAARAADRVHERRAPPQRGGGQLELEAAAPKRLRLRRPLADWPSTVRDPLGDAERHVAARVGRERRRAADGRPEAVELVESEAAMDEPLGEPLLRVVPARDARLEQLGRGLFEQPQKRLVGAGRVYRL